jgi:hypothetical protein
VKRALKYRVASLEAQTKRRGEPRLLAALTRCREVMCSTLGEHETLEQRVVGLAGRIEKRCLTASDTDVLSSLPQDALSVLGLDAEGLIRLYHRIYGCF